MTEGATWYDNFMETLYKKYPKKNQLTEALMNLLCIEREAVYRRLRKNVAFTVDEIVTIAATWNISLDEIIEIYHQQIPFKLRLWNYLDPSKEELNEMRMIIEGFDKLKTIPDMEYMEISNKLPRLLTSGFSYLSRLCLLKLMYHYHANDSVTPFAKVFYHEKVVQFSSDFYQASKNLPCVNFVWDNMIFYHTICDIRYFHSIYLITDEEKELLKKDLYDLLDYMSNVASRGRWPETNQKVNLYISHLNIDTNYIYYYHSGEVKLCSIHAFGKNELYTEDPSIARDFRIWMQSKKRSSIQISEADEKNRIEFFTKQRQLVDSL